MTTRVMPPGTPASGSTVNAGRAGSFFCAPGGTLDVADNLASIFTANGWAVIGSVGPTTARSMAVVPTCAVHVDTTIGKIVYSDGSTFRDHTGRAS